jgi:hypothetical protein
MLRTTREELASVEDKLRALREEKSRAVATKKLAIEAAQANNDDASLRAAEAAAEAVKAVEARIEQVSEEQLGLLRRIGDAESGRAGFAWSGVDGWEKAARQLDLQRGELRVDVSAASLLAAAFPRSVPSTASPLATSPGPSPAATAPGALPSSRWLYPALPSAPFGDLGDVNATDFVVTIPMLGDAASGLTGVERPVDATTTKATLTPVVSLASPQARQFAIVLDAVPSQLFDSQSALRQLLSVEVGRRLSENFDSHVVDKIEAAAPPTASTGADLLAKIRNGIADARDLGCEPSVIALTPSDAASLDLTKDDGGYTFRVDAPRFDGAGSVVWSLRVREVPTISDPTLISPGQLGVVYLGDASVLVDPYSGLKTNQVRVRVEAEGTFHVRNVMQGAFAIS